MTVATKTDVCLSRAQQRIWNLRAAGHLMCCRGQVQITGELNAKQLRRAFELLIRRYDLLRTVFTANERTGEVIQDLREPAPLVFREVSLVSIPSSAREARIRSIADKDAVESARIGACVVSLAALENDRVRLLLALPAMQADSQTIQLLCREVAALYASVSLDAGHDTKQYEYVAGRLVTSDGPAGDYWDKLGWESLLAQDLPIERWTADPVPFSPASYEIPMPSDIEKRLSVAARQWGTAEDAILLGCWQALLWRLLGQSPFVLGVPFDGRREAQFENTVGHFECVLPVVCNPDRNTTFKAYLVEVAEQLEKHAEFQEAFSGFMACAAQSFPLAFEARKVPEPFRSADTEWAILSAECLAEPYRLRLSYRRGLPSHTVELHYDSSRIALREISTLASQFTEVTAMALDDPQRLLRDLRPRATDLRISRPATHSVHTGNIVDELAQQAERWPDRVAIVTPHGTRTYAELARDAGRIGTALRANGVGPEVVVGLIADRAAETISALWGVLFAGGAYSPLDPNSPRSYIAKQVANSAISILLARREHQNLAAECDCAVLWIEDLLSQDDAAPAICPREIHPEQLAYAIHTSGSTGAPKAVGIRHSALLNYTRVISERLRLESQITSGPLHFALVSTLSADLGHTCLYPALTTGGCLHIVSETDARDVEAFARYITRHEIDILKIVPSHLRALLDAGLQTLPAKWLIVGGEPFTAQLAERIQAGRPTCAVVNHYGPTEATVGCLMDVIEPDLEVLSPPVLPVGQAISNAEAYVLDEEMQPMSPNIPGELYIGGDVLARGYLARPDITADRFVPDPFSSRPGQRLYRTGDRARVRAGGNIQVLGRADDQVKIRGFRVELGEVEAALLRHPAVSAAAVIVSGEASGPRLIAYLVRRSKLSIERHELRQYLAERLPAAMVPADFTWLDSLPLNGNGKTDRKALAELPVARPSVDHSQVHAQTSTGEKIAVIWAEVLGCERVGVDENFFELGGDSITALQVAASLRGAGIIVTPLQLFQNPTAASLAAVCETNASADRSAATSIANNESRPSSQGEQKFPLSPMQAGMLFYSSTNSAPGLYVSEFTCRFGPEFDPEAFVQAWQRIVDRHTIFRTSFHWSDDGEPYQVVQPPIPLNVERSDWSGLESAQQEGQLNEYSAALCRGIALETAPLMRMALIRTGAGRHSFVWVYHHLLMDAWSERVLNQELAACYEAFHAGREPVLPNALPYHAYVEYLCQRDRSQSQRFWQNYLKGLSHATALPGLIQGRANATAPSAWAAEETYFSEEESGRLREFVRRQRVTLNDLCQGAWALVLGEYSGDDEVVFGATLAARPPELPGADSIIGPILNTLPVRVPLAPGVRTMDWLRDLHESQAEARHHQAVSLIDMQSWCELPRGATLFETFIGFQNASLLYAPENKGRAGLALPVNGYAFRGAWTNYPIALDVEPLGRVRITLSFDTGRVTRTAARQALDCFNYAIEALSHSAETPIENFRRELTTARRNNMVRLQEALAAARGGQIAGFRRRT